MNKETKMIELKNALVIERSKIVLQACEECLNDSIEITYRIISEKTNIPAKTLQRKPYKDIISPYGKTNKRLRN